MKDCGIPLGPGTWVHCVQIIFRNSLNLDIKNILLLNRNSYTWIDHIIKYILGFYKILIGNTGHIALPECLGEYELFGYRTSIYCTISTPRLQLVLEKINVLLLISKSNEARYMIIDSLIKLITSSVIVYNYFVTPCG